MCWPKKAGPRGAVFFRLTKELVWVDRPELILQGGQSRVDFVVPFTLAGVDFTWHMAARVNFTIKLTLAATDRRFSTLVLMLYSVGDLDLRAKLFLWTSRIKKDSSGGSLGVDPLPDIKAAKL